MTGRLSNRPVIDPVGPVRKSLTSSSLWRTGPRVQRLYTIKEENGQALEMSFRKPGLTGQRPAWRRSMVRASRTLGRAKQRCR